MVVGTPEQKVKGQVVVEIAVMGKGNALIAADVSPQAGGLQIANNLIGEPELKVGVILSWYYAP